MFAGGYQLIVSQDRGIMEPTSASTLVHTIQACQMAPSLSSIVIRVSSVRTMENLARFPNADRSPLRDISPVK
jgi:hypothetical protein